MKRLTYQNSGKSCHGEVRAADATLKTAPPRASRLLEKQRPRPVRGLAEFLANCEEADEGKFICAGQTSIQHHEPEQYSHARRQPVPTADADG